MNSPSDISITAISDVHKKVIAEKMGQGKGKPPNNDQPPPTYTEVEEIQNKTYLKKGIVPILHLMNCLRRNMIAIKRRIPKYYK